MNKVSVILKVVCCWASAKIAMLINIDSKIICDKCPNPDVEFSIVVQERLLNILLYHPERILLIFLKDEIRDVSHVLEDLYPSSLVQWGRFDEPHITCTVLKRYSFVPRTSPRNFSKPMHKAINLVVVDVTSNHKSRWCSIKNSILSLYCMLVRLIVSWKRFNQHGLRANASIDFKMIE